YAIDAIVAVINGEQNQNPSARCPAGQKEPIPGWAVILQFFPACELLPCEMYFFQAYEMPAGAAEAIADLEWVPEMLFQPAKGVLAKRTIVSRHVAQRGSILAGCLDRFAGGQSAINQQHRVIMHRVHGGQDAENPAAPFHAGVDLRERRFDLANIG